jgi:Carboxypeptidase regulatory-like domain
MNSLWVVLGSRNSSATKALWVLGAISCLLLTSSPMFAQGTAGRIMGTVTDQSGGAISGATVTVTDTERGVSKTLTTNDSGEYNATNLTPSTYKVRAEIKGFAGLERPNIVVEVGKEVRIDVVLQPGTQEQTVTVTEAAPLVETTTATLGGTLANAEINDMPLNGRNYQNLLSLRPGVAVQPGGGPWTQSSNNVRPDESVWMFEGILSTEWYDTRPMTNLPSFITDGATLLPIDAIQEFNTMENPKAEYGWKPGAVVNVGLKSGTNELHGSAYGFYRSQAWDARNVFNPDPSADPGGCGGSNAYLCAKFPTQLKQFGGVVGGPIKKDKLFFFGGYEGLRDLIGQAIVTSGVPETNGGGGPKKSMVDALHALQTANSSFVPSPVSLGIAGCPAIPATTGDPAWSTYTCTGGLWPANTTGSTGYTALFPNTNISDNGVGKLDYRLNEKNTINGSFLGNYYTGDGMDHPFVNKIFLDTNLIHTFTVSTDWVYAANSHLVNDVRFGWSQISYVFVPDDSQISANGSAPFYVNSGVTQFGGLPNINLGGFEKLGTWHNRPQHFGDNFYDFQDSVSYLAGKHAFKFGVEFASIDLTNAIYDTGRGLVKFGGKQTSGLTDCKGASCPLEDFFAGNPSAGQLLAGNANREEKWGSYAGFAQDDFRVTPRLTINLGLRYSYVSPMQEVNGQWGNFDPTSGMIQQGTGGTLWQPDYNGLSPRAGFSWDLSGKGTTVLRGGLSIIYSTFTAVEFLNQNSFQNSTSLTVAAVPTGAQLQVGDCLTNVANPCKTGGGTITLSSAALTPANLNWNGIVFPSSATTVCGDGQLTNAAQCSILSVDPNLKNPYVTSYSLGLQHTVGNDLSLDLEYVGTRGSRLTGFRDLNQANPYLVNNNKYTSGPLNGEKINPTGQPYYQAFPYLNYINQMSNDSHSSYNSLQITANKRMTHGLSFIAGYTYGHGLDNNSLNRSAYLPQDSTNPGAEYGSSDFDIRHRFTFTASYAVPGIRGFGQLLEGWKLNTIISLQSGQPWQTNDFSNNFRTGGNGGDNSDRWNITGGTVDFKSGINGIPYCSNGACIQPSGIDTSADVGKFSSAQQTAMWGRCVAADNSYLAQAQAAGDPIASSNLAAAGCFVEPSGVLTPNITGTFGNMGRNIFRDSGFKNLDLSVFKTFSWRERYTAQFRVEFFNLFNKPLAANPYGSSNGYGVGNDLSAGAGFGCGCATPDVAAGNPSLGSGGARSMQLGLKLSF